MCKSDRQTGAAMSACDQEAVTHRSTLAKPRYQTKGLTGLLQAISSIISRIHARASSVRVNCHLLPRRWSSMEATSCCPPLCHRMAAPRA